MSSAVGPTIPIPTGAAAQNLAPPAALPGPTGPVVVPGANVTISAQGEIQQGVHPLLRNFEIKDKELVSPEVEQSLAAIIDDYFRRAATGVASLELKDTYETLLRPSNVNNLIKTELNPELKQKRGGISKAAIVKDGSGRGVQNALVRAGVALTLIANEVLAPSDKSAPDLMKILNLCMLGLKCTAYGVHRLNSFRRQLLKPQLVYCFQSLCDESQEQLQYLLPPDLAAILRAESEKQKVAIPLTNNAQKRKGRKRRGPRIGRGNHGNQGQHRFPQQQQQHHVYQPQYQPHNQQFGKSKLFSSPKPAFKN